MKTNFLHTRSSFVISLLAFKSILDFSYVNFIHVIYAEGYQRFHLNIDISNYAAFWLIYISFIPVLRHKFIQISDYFSCTAVIGLIGPMCTISGLDATRPAYPVIISAAAIMIIAVMCRPNFSTFNRLPQLPGISKWAVAASSFMVLFTAFWYVASGAASNLNFDFTAVYEFRSENSELADVGIFAYINIWSYKVFSVFLLTYAIWKKNKNAVLALLILQIFFFAVSAHKSVAFFPILVFAIWFYFRNNNSAIALPITFGITILFAYAMYEFYDAQFFASIMIRRIFFVPAATTYDYFEFFVSSPHIYWADSVLSPFIDYNYSLPLSFIIGDFLLSPEMGANNGFISRGYAHAGLVGVGIYILMLWILLKFIDSITQSGVPLWVGLAVTAIPIRTVLLSSDLFTTLVSHGFLWSVVLLLAIRKRPAALKCPEQSLADAQQRTNRIPLAR